MAGRSGPVAAAHQRIPPEDLGPLQEQLRISPSGLPPSAAQMVVRGGFLCAEYQQPAKARVHDVMMAHMIVQNN